MDKVKTDLRNSVQIVKYKKRVYNNIHFDARQCFTSTPLERALKY
jgi:hypothetical protein